MPCEPPDKQAGRTWNGRIEMQSTANLPSTVTWRCLSLCTLFGDAKGGVWWDAFPPSPPIVVAHCFETPALDDPRR